MEELNAINDELINNEKEDEDDDDEEIEGLGGSDFNDLAHESLEQVCMYICVCVFIISHIHK